MGTQDHTEEKIMQYQIEMYYGVRLDSEWTVFTKTTSLPFVPFVGLVLSGAVVWLVKWDGQKFKVALREAEVLSEWRRDVLVQDGWVVWKEDAPSKWFLYI